METDILRKYYLDEKKILSLIYKKNDNIILNDIELETLDKIVNTKNNNSTMDNEMKNNIYDIISTQRKNNNDNNILNNIIINTNSAKDDNVKKYFLSEFNKRMSSYGYNVNLSLNDMNDKNIKLLKDMIAYDYYFLEAIYNKEYEKLEDPNFSTSIFAFLIEHPRLFTKEEINIMVKSLKQIITPSDVKTKLK